MMEHCTCHWYPAPGADRTCLLQKAPQADRHLRRNQLYAFEMREDALQVALQAHGPEADLLRINRGEQQGGLLDKSTVGDIE